MSCLFCKIASGSLPCHKVYENAAVLAFLDINPLAKGHTLVIPKKHSDGLLAMDRDNSAALFAALPLIAKGITTATKVSDFNVLQNNGRSAADGIFRSKKPGKLELTYNNAAEFAAAAAELIRQEEVKEKEVEEGGAGGAGCSAGGAGGASAAATTAAVEG